MSHLQTFEKDGDALAEVAACCSSGVVCVPQDGDVIILDPTPVGTPPLSDCVKTECVYINEDDPTDPFCGSAIWECASNPGVPYVFNPETFLTEIVDMSKVGKNPSENAVCTRPFVCEFPADGADVTLTEADIVASLAGALFPGTTLPADDAATVHLHEMTATLTHQGDEAEGGFVATNCQAVATDTETGKTKDLEPGGDFPLQVEPGVSVPPFSIVVTDGSNLVVCGSVSVQKAKDGTAIAKEAEREEG